MAQDVTSSEMMHRRTTVALAAWLACAVVSGLIAGQQGQPTGEGASSNGPQGRGPGRGADVTGRPVDVTQLSSFDPAQRARGHNVFVAQCASCHGDNARGGHGKTEVDLLRSELVLMDHGGRELEEYLKFGRPERNMPKFGLPHDDAVAVAEWLHYQVSLSALWAQYTKPSVFSGDVKAGEAFFNGPVGRCNACHSPAGDLKGISAMYGNDAPSLQAAILSGGGRGGGRAGGSNVTATVALATGQTFVGTPTIINDFVVEIRLPTGETKTWLRDGEWPKVTRDNRLQAHINLMLKYTDDDIHNLAAYLNTFK
jgi:cytochrome c oxidase cbb3-type subunit 3